MNDEEFEKVKDYALRFLSFRPRSSQELKQRLKIYLAKKNLSEDLIEKVIAFLREKNFINDVEFAKWWAAARKSQTIKGINAIRLELVAKGINKDIIDEILVSVDGSTELQKAIIIINRKLPLFRKSYPKNLLKLKLGRLLFNRGFSSDVIKKAIDECFKKI